MSARLPGFLVVALITLLVAAVASTAVVTRSTTTAAEDRSAVLFGGSDAVIVYNVIDRTGDIDHSIARGSITSYNGFDPTAERYRSQELSDVSRFEERGGSDAIVSLLGGDALVTRSAFIDHNDSSQQPFDATSSWAWTFYVDIDPHHRFADGLVDLVEGRFPQAADEIAVTASRSELTGIEIGDRVMSGPQPQTVVGLVAAAGGDRADFLLVTPEAFDQLATVPGSVQHRIHSDVRTQEQGDVDTLEASVEAIVGHRASVIPRGSINFSIDSSTTVWMFAAPVFVGIAGSMLIVPLAAFGVARGRFVRSEARWLGLIAVVLGIVLGLLASEVLLVSGWLRDVGDRHFLSTRNKPADLLAPVVIGLIATKVATSWASRRLTT